VDASRADIFTADPNARRELMVQAATEPALNPLAKECVAVQTRRAVAPTVAWR